MTKLTESQAAHVNWLLSQPWLIHQDALGTFLASMQSLMASDTEAFSPGVASPADEDDDDRPYMVDEDQVAHFNFHGVVGKRVEPWLVRWGYMTDVDTFNRDLAQAVEDDSVKSIRIDFDSPGGVVTGVSETMRHVRALAQRKRIVSYTSTLMASAAYFIASQTSRIIATETARVGSLGSMMQIRDYSEMYADWGIKVDVITNKEGTYKGAGAMGTSLTSAQRKQFAENNQILFDLIFGLTKDARPNIKDAYAQGQVVFGHDAYWNGSGLVDDLDTSVS